MEFQASVSDCSNPRLFCLVYNFTLHAHRSQSFSVSSCSSSSYCPPISSLQHCFAYISHPLSTSYPGVDHHPNGFFSLPPPASLLCSSLRPTPHACFRCHFLHPFSPPLSPLACANFPVSPLGVVRCWYLQSFISPPIYLPVCIVVSCHLLMFGFILLGWHFFGAKTYWPGRLHSLAVASPSPCPPQLNGPAGAFKDTRLPPPHVPPPPPLMVS